VTGVTVLADAAGVRFTVRVHPRARRSEFAGAHDGALRVRLQAPPVDGAANAALVALLADALGVPRRAVRIVSGGASRTKCLEVTGVGAEAIRLLVQGR
jgi:uncharacterized protein